ncbi:hypothetical protein Tco_0180622 [Tanacetum coccineum]
MDPIILLGQKNALAEYMILFGADNRPPMLDKDLYDSWKSRMELYMQNKEHGRMILESVEHGKIQADCDMKATNIILQGLPADIYSLQERECKLYDAFDKFTHIKGESLHTLPPKWSKFVTDVKLVKDLHTSNFDQLHAYLEQHELHANEVRFSIPVFSPTDDPIACLNKAMAFLTTVASSRVTVQQYLGRQGQNYSGKGHMARQCTQPKRPRNAAWYKEKAMLAEAGQILDEEQLAFLADPGILADQAQTIIPHNAAF